MYSRRDPRAAVLQAKWWKAGEPPRAERETPATVSKALGGACGRTVAYPRADCGNGERKRRWKIGERKEREEAGTRCALQKHPLPITYFSPT